MSITTGPKWFYFTMEIEGKYSKGGYFNPQKMIRPWKRGGSTSCSFYSSINKEEEIKKKKESHFKPNFLNFLLSFQFEIDDHANFLAIYK